MKRINPSDEVRSWMTLWMEPCAMVQKHHCRVVKNTALCLHFGPPNITMSLKNKECLSYLLLNGALRIWSEAFKWPQRLINLNRKHFQCKEGNVVLMNYVSYKCHIFILSMILRKRNSAKPFPDISSLFNLLATTRITQNISWIDGFNPMTLSLQNVLLCKAANPSFQ